MKETFKRYLESSYDAKEAKELIEGYSRLECYISGDLDETILSEDTVQKLRKEIYMDVSLSPLDKRIFPEVLKNFYSFTHEQELAAPHHLTKGQGNGHE